MSQAETPVGSSIVAVYHDHAEAERAVRRLHEEGFAMGDLSIIGRDFQMSEEPVGFVNAGDYAKAGAGTGAWFGGLFGLMVGRRRSWSSRAWARWWSPARWRRR